MADQPNILDSTPAPKDLLSELVGDGKKFKTVEDLAQGKLQSDIHIKRLEEEAKVLRDQVATAKSVDDVLAAIKANAALEETPLETPIVPDPKVLPSVGLTAEQVAKIVAEQIKGSETAKQKETNRLQSNNLMTKLFGDKAKEKFEAKATSPELRATLVQLAEVNPTEFITLFQEKGQDSILDNGNKHLNTLNVYDNTGSLEPGTQPYYSDMRKKNPKQYYSPAVQLEMHTAAMKDPSKYFGRP